MKQPILWVVHIYHLGKSILISGKTAFYPRGKEQGYPLVSGTLSFGKWHIILWKRTLIPSGKSTRGNWKITVRTNVKHIKTIYIKIMYMVLQNILVRNIEMNCIEGRFLLYKFISMCGTYGRVFSYERVFTGLKL